ncbi:hypothetical protein D3C84_916770 [compost metagenome]
MNTYKPRPQASASTQISGESNQSRRSPRSSSICRLIKPRVKLPKPKKSKDGALAAFFSASKRATTRKMYADNGRLM